ncbi:hypothetical protein PoB_007082400 [Plakobranchus ocellatus]|uniref:Uncharacterized protein n=1 Tax=Plakobranchus ocellatus TaxID=259542 RepID=A0AAV4DJF3_9GAST|nr:hypothetical protein PoB_007082400 [Plakobranchus ocellatus]
MCILIKGNGTLVSRSLCQCQRSLSRCDRLDIRTEADFPGHAVQTGGFGLNIWTRRSVLLDAPTGRGSSRGYTVQNLTLQP